MSVEINFKLTAAALTAALSQSNVSIAVTHIQFGSGNKTVTGSETALLTPKESAPISGCVPISDNQYRISATIIGSAIPNYQLSEIGLWAGDPSIPGSVLVFYWAMPSGNVATKSTNVSFIFENELYFGDIVPANITIVADSDNALGKIAAHESNPDAHSAFTTPPLGDNDDSPATTKFVQGTVGGFLSIPVGGSSNVTLSPVEAGHGILKFTGALTADINVFVPKSPTFKWQIKNATTGAHTLTVKHSTGTGVTVDQGYNSSLWTDGINVYEAVTSAPEVGFTPVGGIIMWPRPIADIPSNWALCDGTRGTPNMINRFPLGAGTRDDITVVKGTDGGYADTPVVAHAHTATSSVTDPGHAHTYSKASASGIQKPQDTGTAPFDTNSSANTSTSTTGITVATTIDSTGVDGAGTNYPPFVALYYIMRIS